MIWEEIPQFSDQLARKSIECFKRLPKSGKPTRHENEKAEWTVLACILEVYARSAEEYSIQVVSLGTGLKCLPYSKLCKQGQMVHDSHAEVIAKRGFQRYVLDQIIRVGRTSQEQQEEGPFCVTDAGRVILKSGYSFHMYISQSPCKSLSLPCSF
ncbi:hypothetical protein BDB00DRAFT_17660 [Zychaea mexicana]|uniref:uncharacterized protein n=1 Tax=Zychaea mexicana TaxID=64656 RepID=UPI0022FE0B0D|nr:uncharacterized protein BDB00DRAFT_17660 [Zychaea mexicana]KAI9497150.1 hypothetical protein BDB00DRAFT_17660 [Zychaea mexicana]